MEKNTKKKPAVRKIFYLISPQQEHYNSNRFWKLQCRAAAFIFFHSKNLVMWPPSQWPIGWSLARIIMLILVSSTFWSSPIIYIFLGIYSGIWKQYMTCCHFYFFFLIFWLFLGEFSSVPWNQCTTWSPIVAITPFFPKNFIANFHLKMHPGPWGKEIDGQEERNG